MDNISSKSKLPLRSPSFRRKVVQDQLVQASLTTHVLKKLTGKTAGGRQLYTPHEIRTAKLALNNASENINPLNIPPILAARVIKGGTGKTTITANTAAALAFMGYRVLCIDGDPQASLTRLLGKASNKTGVNHFGTAMMFFNEKKLTNNHLERLTVPVFADGMLDLIPAGLNMANLSVTLSPVPGNTTLAHRLICANVPFFGKYDAIFIDCAPGVDLLSYSLMVASTTLFAPVAPDYEAFEAINMLFDNLTQLRDAEPICKRLDVDIVVNGYRDQLAHTKQFIELLASVYTDRLCNIMIPFSPGYLRQTAVMLGEEDAQGTFLEQDPLSSAMKSIFDLARYFASTNQILIARDPRSAIPNTRQPKSNSLGTGEQYSEPSIFETN